MIDAVRFANTVSGEVLLPLISGVLLLALGAGARAAGKLLKEIREDHAEAQQGRVEIIARIIAVEKEVRPNHGGSMRDAIARIEQRVDDTSRQLDNHLADGRLQLDRIDRALEERPKPPQAPGGTQ